MKDETLENLRMFVKITRAMIIELFIPTALSFVMIDMPKYNSVGCILLALWTIYFGASIILAKEEIKREEDEDEEPEEEEELEENSVTDTETTYMQECYSLPAPTGNTVS